MNNEKYAVLEWEADNNKANVIAKEQSYKDAKNLVQIAPSYYYREIISMKELETLKK